MNVTASDIIAMLQRHYLPEGRPPGGVLAAEIGAPDGTRRADAIWAPLTLSGGGLVGHEVKVSRSDVLAELADPTKPDPWLQYCDRWWLTVSDPALVDGLDIPESWGIMAPPSGRRTRSMTIVRPAPTRKVGDTGPAWRRVLSWNHHRTAEQVTRLSIDLRRKVEEVAQLERQLDEQRLAGGSIGDPRVARVGKILRGVEKAARDSARTIGGTWFHGDDITDDDIIAALTDLAVTRAVTRDARWALDRLVSAAEQFRDPMADIAKQLAALRQEVSS